MVNIVKNFLIMLKTLQQMHLRLLQKEQFKTQQKTVTNENDKEIPKGRSTSPEKKTKNNY